MIHVVAIITAKPGQRENILKAARENLAAVRAENGCIEYGPVVDVDDVPFQTELGPDTFVVIEKWKDMDALKAHSVAPHMKAFGSKVKDLVANRAIHVLTSAE
jgi:quinol monooxygenase YgiN